MQSRLEELFALVRQIPPGRVSYYGRIGRLLTQPVSGLLVGKWMGCSEPDVPWWRVVGRDGTIKTFKRGPEAGLKQRMLLEQEGVTFDEEGRVLAQHFWDDFG